ncbi:MAG: phosphodiester glycosidase family protein [Chitinophagaceae bacterium]|nr:MAG: phosphodiester glycosidase family protein [Chitinophagaceae bacterium]
MRSILLSLFLVLSLLSYSQWQNVDSLYGPLPLSVKVFVTTQRIDTAPFKAYCVIADLGDKALDFTTDTTLDRRATPAQFYAKNNKPLLVVNGTFFSFQTNRNLNAVIRNGKLLSGNVQTLAGKGKDTLTYRHTFPSAIGISKKRKADVAWLYTDTVKMKAYAAQWPLQPLKDSTAAHSLKEMVTNTSLVNGHSSKLSPSLQKWKMQTAIGGGPVLVQNGAVQVTNNEELKFAGKAIHDKHPRTAMGYTADNRLVILVIEGRSKGSGGATLVQTAQLLKDLGCVEALNLDGGGSSCLLVNGKETIRPSDKEGQRSVPAVFLIKKR